MVRFKNRYLLCVLELDEDKENNALKDVSLWTIWSSVRESIQENFGDVAMGVLSSSFAVKYWSAPMGMLLIRASREHFRLVWASVSMMTNLTGLTGTIRFQVIHVGGTIRSCQKTGIEHMRRVILADMGARKTRCYKHHKEFEREKAQFAAIKEEMG